MLITIAYNLLGSVIPKRSGLFTSIICLHRTLMKRWKALACESEAGFSVQNPDEGLSSQSALEWRRAVCFQYLQPQILRQQILCRSLLAHGRAAQRSCRDLR